MIKKRKIPQRKCIVTNEMKPKKELIRVFRNKEGKVFVDPSGKQNGRGAYLSRDTSVIDKAEKSRAIARELNTEVDESIYEELRKLITGKQHGK